MNNEQLLDENKVCCDECGKHEVLYSSYLCIECYLELLKEDDEKLSLEEMNK